MIFITASRYYFVSRPKNSLEDLTYSEAFSTFNDTFRFSYFGVNLRDTLMPELRRCLMNQSET